VALMRKARLRSFNDYREAYGLRRLTRFEGLTANTEVRERLEALLALLAGVRSMRQPAEGEGMTFQAGDRVVAESESTERPARYGTVREVVHEDPHARYRIEWDDGRTSVYTPAAGALKVAPETAKRAG
jgi:hypothetical protein